MIGAIIGDVIGSVYENNAFLESNDFEDAICKAISLAGIAIQLHVSPVGLHKPTIVKSRNNRLRKSACGWMPACEKSFVRSKRSTISPIS